MSLETDGFTLLPGLFSGSEVARLLEEVEPVARAAGSRGGVRTLLSLEPMRKLSRHPRLVEAVAPVLGPGAEAVRGILFDKTPNANWKLAFHQDLKVPLARHYVALPGWNTWSVKDGVAHAEPPAPVLEGMLAVRIHLDDGGAGNGALRIIPGSHRGGRLSGQSIGEWRRARREVVCAASAGDVLLMRPLVLHASSASARPGHRRVIHLEYAAAGLLPAGVEWGQWR